MKHKNLLFPIFTSRNNCSIEKNNINSKDKCISKSQKLVTLSQRKYENGRQSLPSKERFPIIKTDLQRIKNIVNQRSTKNQSILHQISSRIEKKLAQPQIQKLKVISSSLQVKKYINKQHNLSIQKTKGLTTRRVVNKNTLENEQKYQNQLKQMNSVKLSTQKVLVRKRKKQFTRINEELIYDIRQNYLDANFNKRKSRLKQITKQNRKIYQRINSQKSFYSNKSLNKSFQQNQSLSRRLSNSKLLNRSRLSSSSQRSITSSRYSVKSKIDKRAISKKILKIQSKNIKDLQNDQILNFEKLFSNVRSNDQKVVKENKGSQSKENKLPMITDLNLGSASKTLEPRGQLKGTILSKIDENIDQRKGERLSKIVEAHVKTAQPRIGGNYFQKRFY